MSKKKKQTSGNSKVVLVTLGVVAIMIATVYSYSLVNRDVVKPIRQNASTAESKSRDAVRKSAIRSYSNALELYKNQNGSYPIKSTCTDPGGLDLSISNPPKEPLRDPGYSTQDSNWPNFCYQSDANGTKFIIWTKLENTYSDKTSQINTTPYFTVPSVFESSYYFMQSEG